MFILHVAALFGATPFLLFKARISEPFERAHGGETSAQQNDVEDPFGLQPEF